MILRLNGNLTIENLRKYPVEAVEELRALLTAGGEAHADPHRNNFYDLANGSRVFYIHLTPSGRVLLLAIWLKDSAERTAENAVTLAESP